MTVTDTHALSELFTRLLGCTNVAGVREAATHAWQISDSMVHTVVYNGNSCAATDD